KLRRGHSFHYGRLAAADGIQSDPSSVLVQRDHGSIRRQSRTRVPSLGLQQNRRPSVDLLRVNVPVALRSQRLIGNLTALVGPNRAVKHGKPRSWQLPGLAGSDRLQQHLGPTTVGKNPFSIRRNGGLPDSHAYRGGPIGTAVVRQAIAIHVIDFSRLGEAEPVAVTGKR